MNSKHIPTIPPRTLLLLGSAMVIFGCFLPWEKYMLWQAEGDFVPKWQSGIQFFPVFEDHGGMLVLLLAILILGFVFRSKSNGKYQIKGILAAAIALFLISVYHLVTWLEHRAVVNMMLGAPAIQIGLILIGLGSILILATAFIMSSKRPANYA